MWNLKSWAERIITKIPSLIIKWRGLQQGRIGGKKKKPFNLVNDRIAEVMCWVHGKKK